MPASRGVTVSSCPWLSAAWAVCLAALSIGRGVVAADPPPKPRTAAEMKRLDARLAEVSTSFVRDTTTLISAYETIGQFDRAKLIVEALGKLDPTNEQIKAKLKQLDERILSATEMELEIDPEKPWVPVGRVEKGRLIRVEASGSYKFTATVETGPAGVASSNPATDLVGNVPLGALMGVILPLTPAATDGERPQNQPRPFAIGASHERPADRDGMLYLRLNVPPGAKCTGTIQARINGAEREPRDGR